jgi:hypothetical protein
VPNVPSQNAPGSILAKGKSNKTIYWKRDKMGTIGTFTLTPIKSQDIEL